jgi:hypothetical protein
MGGCTRRNHVDFCQPKHWNFSLIWLRLLRKVVDKSNKTRPLKMRIPAHHDVLFNEFGFHAARRDIGKWMDHVIGSLSLEIIGSITGTKILSKVLGCCSLLSYRTLLLHHPIPNFGTWQVERPPWVQHLAASWVSTLVGRNIRSLKIFKYWTGAGNRKLFSEAYAISVVFALLSGITGNPCF